eukprot:jgi/Tetstr1/442449/TSEL_003195.t1
MDPATLPIRGHAGEIAAAVAANRVVVVIGETGSGKTTQIAQILHEAGLCEGRQICVTQPRRVAAVSVARRVAEEMAVDLGEEVGYAVRFEERCSRRTRIKYVTDGTLLRELLDDPQLRQYGVLVLDEAHERSLNTDLLFGILKGLVTRREPPLKLVVTSATLDGQKFCQYFHGAPLFNVSGRCFPVEIIHSMEQHSGSKDQYMDAAAQTAMDIHCNHPDGDILVFLTGQAEIDKTCRKLNEMVSNMPEGSCAELLARVFVRPPAGCRRCIVSTNIAETSITVDGVVYVIDSGVVKAKQYDPATGMEALQVGPISRVQATQRAGRAGRTRPGKCFRLYTRKYFDRDMPNVTVPEIQRTCLAATLLYLKSLPLDIDVLGFDYLDAPDEQTLQDALRQLFILDAIDKDGRITELGRAMSKLPLEPSLSRALLRAVELKCAGEMLIVASMLAAEHVFAPNRGPGDGPRPNAAPPPPGRAPPGATEALKELIAEGLGDHVLLLRVFLAWDAAGSNSFQVARELGLDHRGMRFARDVKRQLEGVLTSSAASMLGGAGGSAALRVNSPLAIKPLRKAICTGYATHLARRMQLHNGYRTISDNSKLAHLHPSSSFLGMDEDGMLPEWIVYHEFIATSKPFLSKVCPVEARWTERIIPKAARHRRQAAQRRRDRSAGGAGRGRPCGRRGGVQQEGAPQRRRRRQRCESAFPGPEEAQVRRRVVAAHGVAEGQGWRFRVYGHP